MVYWLALLAVAAARPLIEYWRITTSASGHGTIQYSFSGDLLPLALWIAGPPLALFAVWVATRSRAPEPQVDERVR